MSYKKCQICDLNYIKSDEKYCKNCDPRNYGVLTVTDLVLAHDELKETRLKEYSDKKEQTALYLAYRYNVAAKY